MAVAHGRHQLPILQHQRRRFGCATAPEEARRPAWCVRGDAFEREAEPHEALVRRTVF